WEKAKRTQQVYLPAGHRWRDAWNPDKTYEGGRTISAAAEMYQLPLFIRDGSAVKLGDLNQLWRDSVDIARKKPDLRELESSVNAWFEKQNRGLREGTGTQEAQEAQESDLDSWDSCASGVPVPFRDGVES